MASKKSKVLAIAFCAAVMSGIYAPNVTYALPAGFMGGYHPKDEQHVVYGNDKTTSESGIVVNDPNIKHPAVGNHTDQCGENLYDTYMTLGQFNKVVDDLVETDKNITNKVDEVSETVDKINDAYEKGELKGEKGEKGDKGDQGIQGEKGDKGDKGDQGIQGEKGEKGDKGDQGIQGEKGEDGKDGQDGKDGASIASGEYNVQDGTGIVQMPIEDEDGNKVGDVQINNIASQNDLKDETVARENADKELADKIGQEEMNRVNEDAAIRGEISQEHADRVAADADHQEQLDDHSQQLDAVRGEISEEHRVNGEQNEILADHQEQLDDHSQQLDEVRGEISSEIRDRTEADEKLQQSIDIQREVIGAGSTDELKGAYSGTNYIKDANNMAEADVILDREISDVNSRVDGIENRVDGLEDRIDKVGAMSAAIANLRTMGYDPAAPTEVAVGVGQYRDETGMALGLFHYPNRDFMLSLSVSTSGDEYMGGIGATWKFGRKSPEKVAEIKKAQAEADARRAEEQKLAKAEEMKKAAKEAKVQAQMERHAKMLAEQEAQAEA